jgi:hypothetical protein
VEFCLFANEVVVLDWRSVDRLARLRRHARALVFFEKAFMAESSNVVRHLAQRSDPENAGGKVFSTKVTEEVIIGRV